MKDEAKIICPNCGTAIDVNNYVNSQIELITHEEKRRIEDKFNKLTSDLNKLKQTIQQITEQKEEAEDRLADSERMTINKDE